MARTCGEGSGFRGSEPLHLLDHLVSCNEKGSLQSPVPTQQLITLLSHGLHHCSGEQRKSTQLFTPLALSEFLWRASAFTAWNELTWTISCRSLYENVLQKHALTFDNFLRALIGDYSLNQCGSLAQYQGRGQPFLSVFIVLFLSWWHPLDFVISNCLFWPFFTWCHAFSRLILRKLLILNCTNTAFKRHATGWWAVALFGAHSPSDAVWGIQELSWGRHIGWPTSRADISAGADPKLPQP